MSPQDLPYARVLIHDAGAADTERLVGLARALPAGVPVYASGMEGEVAQRLGWRSAPSSNAVLATLTALRSVDGAKDTLLLSAFALLPPFAFERLARAAGGEFDVLSALSNAEPELSPLPEGERAELGDGGAWDAGAFLAADHRVAECTRWSPSFSLWRSAAQFALNSHHLGDADELPQSIRSGVVDDLFVADLRLPLVGPAPTPDPRHPSPASPLSRMRARLRPLPPELACYPGVEPRPVVLHVVHGWGGGVERFVRDLATADEGRIHIALRAVGDSGRRRYGEAMELLLAREPKTVLRRWPLARGIAHTSDGNAGYRALLRELLDQFAVDAVIVSSLIGHDLAALETGRKTLIVCHDYYPLWPVLHCDFGDVTRNFDRTELERELGAGATMPFAERDAEAWWRLRERYLAALAEADAVLVAPSQSVRANLTRLAGELARRRIVRVGHGLAPFLHPSARRDPPPRQRLRVLVLGRIGDGKGERLLREVIPESARHCDFFLVGCGKAGEAFFGRGRVHVELDYERERLPELVRRIAPDLALIAASVAETFSYTLSELRALGVPVLATRLGSLAERIRHGEDGLLIAPRADLISAALGALAQDRAPLNAIRSRLGGWRERDLAQMAHDYDELLPTVRSTEVVATAVPVSLGAELNQVSVLLARAERERARLAALAGAQQRDLERRGEWGFELGRQLAERTRWAESLVRERDLSREALDRLGVEFEERTRWALELEQRRVELEDERAALLNSTSWRITRPLRYAMRKLRSLRAVLGYRARRARALLGRTRMSLRQRGLFGTVRRAAELLRSDTPSLPQPQVPELGGSFQPFSVPEAAEPRVSLVIPVYNQFAHTLVCLKALASIPATVGFETVVVDDCSSDETAERLPEIGGIRVVRNAENLGFIGACNAGADAARGEYVVFLNNDTAPQPGWLEALLDTFASRPACGLAGAKLVYPDGRLQEAGGIVFSDASGWNYGRGEDPARPEYNYVREVDYCSGAALMIRRELFRELGGFDAYYTPAYYEDTDLAFKVRARGLRVLYQPRSVVVHFEGATSGTDVATGTKRYQVVNQAKFRGRWLEALARQPRPGTPIELAREHRARGRLLMIDATTPQPDHDSGSLRMVNVMQVLGRLGWKVTFFAENRAFLPGYSDALQALGVEVLHHPYLGDPVAWLREHGREFDAIWVSRHYVLATFLPVLREYAPRARLIFDTVDLHYLREQRAAELARDLDLSRIAGETKARELRLVRVSDVTLVVSPVEQNLLRREAPSARIEVLSNVHRPPERCAGYAERRDLLFVGGFQHPPNVDAVRWFAQAIWPSIAKALPEVRCHVIGSRVPEEIAALADQRLLVHGYVPELEPYLEGCRISVAPLRYGAGVKGKVNQAMAYGQAVVATPMAVEGMQLEPGVDVLVADDAARFAESVIALYDDAELWQRLSERGRENVARHFSFDAAEAALKRILPA